MHLVFFNKKLSLFMKIVDVSVFILSLVLIVICFGQNLINIISRSYRVWLQKQSLIGTWMEHNPCSPIYRTISYSLDFSIFNVYSNSDYAVVYYHLLSFHRAR